jgi:hypothetical protein
MTSKINTSHPIINSYTFAALCAFPPLRLPAACLPVGRVGRVNALFYGTLHSHKKTLTIARVLISYNKN